MGPGQERELTRRHGWRPPKAELASAGGYEAFAAYIDCEKCYDNISLSDLAFQGCMQGLGKLVSLAAAQYAGQRYVRWAGAMSKPWTPPTVSLRAAPWPTACSTCFCSAL